MPTCGGRCMPGGGGPMGPLPAEAGRPPAATFIPGGPPCGPGATGRPVPEGGLAPAIPGGTAPGAPDTAGIPELEGRAPGGTEPCGPGPTRGRAIPGGTGP